MLLGGMLPKGNTDELRKLSGLLNHFEQHLNVESKPLSFLEFFLLHYSPFSDHWEPEHAAELPFHGSFASAMAFLVFKINFDLMAGFSVHTPSEIAYSNSYTLILQSFILQPPRA
jgi:hypothetical protein